MISSGLSFTCVSLREASLVALMRGCNSCLRRSRRPRTLPSARCDPICRTIPPMRLGSTARRRLDLAAGRLLDRLRRSTRASSSESSYDVVSSTVRRFCACATSASSSALISAQLAGPALLGDEADEVADELVGVRPRAARAPRPCPAARSAGCAGTRAARAPRPSRRASAARSAATASTRSASCAASKSARAYMRCATATRSALSPARRSRARRSPRR